MPIGNELLPLCQSPNDLFCFNHRWNPQSTICALAGLTNRRCVPGNPALSPTSRVVVSARMAYLTMEAEIDHGRIIPKEPEKLPATGKALLTVLESVERKPDWDKVMSLLGTMQNKVDGLSYEREVRAEWDERERQQWGSR
jgi:hypothetical protein